MRLQIPIALGFLAGAFMIVQFFVPYYSLQVYYEQLLDWAIIIGAFWFWAWAASSATILTRFAAATLTTYTAL